MLIARHVAALMFSVAMATLGVGVATGEEYPNKPIRIVTGEPGGSSDFMTRLIAQGLTGPTGQPIIVENRPSSIVGELVSKASPDGYSLLIVGASFWTAPLMQKLPYDPVRDFAAITLVASAPNILVVHPSVAATSIKELIAVAKANPGALNYASGGGSGSANHLAGELFNSMAGTKIVRIPYKGSGPALNDLLSGQVQLMFASTLSVAPHSKSGKLRSLAVTSPQPSALAPGLPTVAASGLPGYESRSMQGLWVPAKTPSAIITRLNQETVRALNQPVVKQKVFDFGSEIVGSSPAQSVATIKADMVRLGTVIRDAGIRLE